MKAERPNKKEMFYFVSVYCIVELSVNLNRGNVMNEIRKQLLQTQHELERKYESPSEIIERLKREGKSMRQIEQEILKMNRIQGVYDSVVTALRILES